MIVTTISNDCNFHYVKENFKTAESFKNMTLPLIFSCTRYIYSYINLKHFSILFRPNPKSTNECYALYPRHLEIHPIMTTHCHLCEWNQYEGKSFCLY